VGRVGAGAPCRDCFRWVSPALPPNPACCEAEAAAEDLDPDRISYTVTLRAVRRQIPAVPHPDNRSTVIREVLSQLLPRRRQRNYPRLTRRSTAFRREAAAQRQGPVSYHITINIPARTANQPGP
jgi:hypothetical protein